MMNRTLNAVLAIATSISLVGPALAAGQQPKGKPFIVLENQIIEVNNAVTDLDERVDLVVDDIIRSIAVAVESIEQLIDVNQQAVLSINASIGDLESQLSFLGTDPAALETAIADLQADTEALEAQIAALGSTDAALAADIATNNATILALQEQLGGLRDLESSIDENLQLILILEGRIAELEADLAIKQQIVAGTCNPGFALVAIVADGSVICEEILHPEPVASGKLRTRILSTGRATGNTGASGSATTNLICNADELAVDSGYLFVNGRSNVVGMVTSQRTAQIRMNQPTAGLDFWTQFATCARVIP